MLCAGAGDGDYANITNIYVHCALMRGVSPRILSVQHLRVVYQLLSL